MQRITRIYFISLDVLWALALIGLPLTTFPMFANLTGAIVAPFSGLPIMLILLFWLLPVLFLKKRKASLPIEVWPLFIFVLIALLSSAFAHFIQIPSLKNSTPLHQELRAFITLGIGIAIYMVCASWPSDSKKIRKSLQWINIGGIIMLLWTSTQVIYILTNAESYPQWVLEIQKFLVIKPEYFFYRGNRTSGLAYEASWFAHQLVMLYIPLWLAATIQNKSAFNFRILRIKNFQGFTLENILLPIGLFGFLLSSPRVALISLLLVFLFLFIRFNVFIVRKVTQQIMSRRNSNRPASLLIRVSITTVIVLFLSFVYLGLAFGAAYILSHRDWRLALLFSSKFSWLEIRSLLRLDESMIIIYGARLAFLERVVYWLTGWHVFNDYPFLGVGLGNVGFFFVQKVPPAGWNSYEIRNVINVISSVPNIKGFWIRLLSETGILGFFVFLGWYVVIGKSARLLQRNKDNIAKIIALAGLLSLIAFIGEGFSIDSFAMPYLWVIAGLISVNSMIYRREISQNLTTPPTNPNK